MGERRGDIRDGDVRIFGYIRVSTKKQKKESYSFDRQIQNIYAYARENNLCPGVIYCDVGCRDEININGARMLREIEGADILICESLDRLGNLRFALPKYTRVIYVSDITKKENEIIGCDMDSDELKNVELKKISRKETSNVIKEGLKRAKLANKTFGRPKADVDMKEVKRMIKKGFSYRMIGSEIGVSHNTIKRRCLAANLRTKFKEEVIGE